MDETDAPHDRANCRSFGQFASNPAEAAPDKSETMQFFESARMSGACGARFCRTEGFFQMAGPSKAEIAQLRQRIVDLLNSDAVQKINFSFRKVRVSGSDYSYVALAMVGKSSHINYNFSVAAGAAATYQPKKSNTFSFPSTSYGATNAFEKMTIVHECTHAVIDAKRALGQIPQLDNEISAYIAGGLYNVFNGAPFTPPGAAGIYPEAHKLTKRIAKTIDTWHYTDTYAIDNGDVAALSSAIVASPTYGGISTTTPYGDDGLEL
jgi:hypothetical protein